MKKRNKQYYFSVEGETEKWYLDYLQDLLNETPSSRYKVSIKSYVAKNPLSYAKRISVISPIVITHWFDYESSDSIHFKEFKDTLKKLKEASSIRGKQIKYHAGYSNYTFELWLILHKRNQGYVTDRSQYLRSINKAFNEEFTELQTYKMKSNFQRLLKKITIDDVKKAIDRAKRIMINNEENGLIHHEYSGYFFYKDNPSLTLHESVEKILKDCGII